MIFALGNINKLYAMDLPFEYGEYIAVTSEISELCPAGNFQLVGSDEDQVLILGPTIFFPNPTGGTQTERPEEKGCLYKITTERKGRSLTKKTTISLCPEEKFNTEIVETITQTSNAELEYHLQSKNEDGPLDIKCKLQKKIKSAKK